MSLLARSRSRSLRCSAAFAALAACAPLEGGGPGDEAEVEAAASAAPALAATPQLQLALSGLATAYATGLDAIGDGDVDRGARVLRGVFTPEAEITFSFPPGYEALDFGAVGPDGLAEAVHGAFQSFGFARTQHDVSNVTVQQTAVGAAVMTSYVNAPHVFPDGTVLDITARFRDDVRDRDGRWLIVRRAATVTSLTRQQAFPLTP